MLNTGVSASEASNFIQQMGRLCDLENQQISELQTLISNMRRINDVLIEDSYQPLSSDHSSGSGHPSTSSSEKDSKKNQETQFKLEYFTTSSKRSQETDSSTLYRNLMEKKSREKQIDAAEEEIKESGCKIKTFYGHKKNISSIFLFFPFLISASTDGEIKLFDFTTNSYSDFSLKFHNDRINSLLLNSADIVPSSLLLSSSLPSASSKYLLLSASRDSVCIFFFFFFLPPYSPLPPLFLIILPPYSSLHFLPFLIPSYSSLFCPTLPSLPYSLLSSLPYSSLPSLASLPTLSLLILSLLIPIEFCFVEEILFSFPSPISLPSFLSPFPISFPQSHSHSPLQ